MTPTALAAGLTSLPLAGLPPIDVVVGVLVLLLVLPVAVASVLFALAALLVSLALG